MKARFGGPFFFVAAAVCFPEGKTQAVQTARLADDAQTARPTLVHEVMQ